MAFFLAMALPLALTLAMCFLKHLALVKLAVLTALRCQPDQHHEVSQNSHQGMASLTALIIACTTHCKGQCLVLEHGLVGLGLGHHCDDFLHLKSGMGKALD